MHTSWTDLATDYKDAFDSLRGKNEEAPMSELPDALRTFGVVMTNDDAEEAKKAAGGGATFSFDQFVAALKATKGHPEFSAAALKVAFLSFDRKGNGYISEKDIKYLLSNSLVEPLSDADISTFITALAKKVSKESNNFNYADIIDVIEQMPGF